MTYGTLILGLCLFFLLVVPQQAQDSAITIKGSDRMVILGQRWAEVYMKQHPEMGVQVTGGAATVQINQTMKGR